MNVAFTICSANYLPFAKALADSVVRHNAEYAFFIALADSFTQYDASSFLPHQVIPVSEMKIDSLDQMNGKYSIFELSCALKPFVTKYFFASIPETELLFYFDADILVYHRLNDAEVALEGHPLVLTPHLSLAMPYQNAIDTELELLRAGIYNAGFFGLKRDPVSFAFLDWWQERVKNHCYNKAAEGLFVDQLWLNFVPLYFRPTCVLFHPGYNLAYWNFSERALAFSDGHYVVNERYPLVFFHFSGYDVQQPALITCHRPNYTLSFVPNYEPLFLEYNRIVKKNNTPDYFSMPASMGIESLKSQKKSRQTFTKAFGKLFEQNKKKS